MRDKVFLDSNVMIYAYFNNPDSNKQCISKRLISNNHAIISTQVLQEMSNILHKKAEVKYTIIKPILSECIRNCFRTYINTCDTILRACDIAERYGFSFYDSMIVAAALENECTALYSEDLQHKQIIDGKLTILNPFV
jgi:predicted nucleic acid-binding protein